MRITRCLFVTLGPGTELAAAQTLRCTGAIGDPSQCERLCKCSRELSCSGVGVCAAAAAADMRRAGNEYHEAFARSGMCQAFAGFDGRLWEANLAFCVVLGYK